MLMVPPTPLFTLSPRRPFLPLPLQPPHQFPQKPLIPAIRMSLNQRVRLLPSIDHEHLHHQTAERGVVSPNKQINHQLLQPTHVLLPTPQRSRIVGRRDAVGLVRPPPDFVHDAILQCGDTEKARQLPKLNQLEVSRVWPVQALVRQRSCVEPLSEVFKVGRVALRQGEGGCNGFAEGVCGVEGSGEKGGDLMISESAFFGQGTIRVPRPVLGVACSRNMSCDPKRILNRAKTLRKYNLLEHRASRWRWKG